MAMDSRCFDLLCQGKCDLTSSIIKLNVNATDKIPNFFTINGEGKVVIASTYPMITITTAKGHNTWMQIELKTINGKDISALTDIEKHVCLGIRKRSETDGYACVLSANNLSEYVDLFDWDTMELVPLLSDNVAESNIIEVGKEVDPKDFGITNADSFDFGSVYRISITNVGSWLKRELTDLRKIYNGDWRNYGHIGIGTIVDQNDQVLTNQLLAMSVSGQLAYSSDGEHWIAHGNISETDTSWWCAPKYGNGIWCVVSYNQGIKRSIDGGRTWSTVANINSYNLSFGNGIFMMVATNGTVYTSPNAKLWEAVGRISTTGLRGLVHGENRWIACTCDGHVYSSENEGCDWELLSDEPYKMNLNTSWNWNGGCYIDGYFYLVHPSSGTVVRSINGKNWTNVYSCVGTYPNTTYYKNRLYVFNYQGTDYYASLPNS